MTHNCLKGDDHERFETCHDCTAADRCEAFNPPKLKTHNFVAFDANDNRIMSLPAVNEQHAKAQVRDQLDRPGRRAILASWRKGGYTVKKMLNRLFVYSGGDHGITLPREVMLRAVGKAGAGDSHAAYLRTDVDIIRHGGLEPGDTAFVQPWNEARERWSFIEIDVAASDLVPVTRINA